VSGASAKIRVGIVDPHPVYRLGLEQTFATASAQVVGSVGTGHEGLSMLRSDRVDIALLDVDLPDMKGVRVLREMASIGNGTPVVVLSADRDGAAIYDALAAGAAGYLTKDAQPRTIVEAVQGALTGEVVISPALHRLVAAEIRLHATAGELDLTPREREVLGLVAEGCSSPEIGRRLYVSHTTVRTHLANAYEKLGVSDRAAAVAQAMRKGLLDPV
jgi:two-component system nitrate/nitrite response regulator NarL